VNKILLIIKREYLTRVKKTSFIVMSILGPLLIAGLLLLVIWMGMAENQNQKLLVIDDLYPTFSDLQNKSTDLVQFDYQNISLDDAKKLLYNSDYTAILHIPSNITFGKTAQLFFDKQPSVVVHRIIETKIEGLLEGINLKHYNISREDFYNVKIDFQLHTIRYKKSGEEEEVNREAAYVGFAFGFFIYMFIFLYGVQVMRGVIEEKTSRIIEVIISSVKPFQLMMGKIVGVAMVGLTQFAIWTLLTVIIVGGAQSVLFDLNFDPSSLDNVQMTTEMMKELQTDKSFTTKDVIDPNNLIFRINWPLMLGMFVFYFLGGYLLYSAMFAAIGAAVDSETDTQQFMLPVSLPLILAYVMSVFIIQNPEGPAAFWFSIIPFTSPVVMMVRVAMGISFSDIWELLLSMSLLIATFVFMTWLAGKVYKTGILMYGKKASYREIWKWLFY